VLDFLPWVRRDGEGAVTGLAPSLSFFGDDFIIVSFRVPEREGGTSEGGIGCPVGVSLASRPGGSGTLDVSVTRIAVMLASPLPRRD